jgi:hypothetical protein
VPEFLRLSLAERRELLEGAAIALGRPAAILEKDVWVCWALGVLFSPETPKMVFKGGTSLSKVYGVIKRFSEDLDITIDHLASGDDITDPLAVDMSNTKRQEFSERMKSFTVQTVREIILPHLERAALQLPITSVRVSDSGEEIFINFESIFGEVYVLPRIKLEFGSRNAIEPSETVRIEPDVLDWKPAQVVTFPSALVPVLVAERTYWEKVTLIHAENTRRNAKANTERYSRHWYDLAMLSFLAPQQHLAGLGRLSPIGARALARTDLRDHVIATKTALFGVAGVHYTEVAAGACKLVPDGALNDGLERDYASMLEAGMFDSTPPAWAELMRTLANLEIQINSLQGLN